MEETTKQNLVIEAIPNDARATIISLIELTATTANEYSDSPKITAFKIGGFDPSYIAASNLNMVSWKSSPLKPAELLEQALSLPPNMVLLGFNIRGNNWPIFDKEHSVNKTGKVLSEVQVKEIYITLGGDKQKADQIFLKSISK